MLKFNEILHAVLIYLAHRVEKIIIKKIDKSKDK